MTVKHNPLMIDGGTKPSWDTDEHKYFVNSTFVISVPSTST